MGAWGGTQEDRVVAGLADGPLPAGPVELADRLDHLDLPGLGPAAAAELLAHRVRYEGVVGHRRISKSGRRGTVVAERGSRHARQLGPSGPFRATRSVGCRQRWYDRRHVFPSRA